jgi:hypothetical protein
VYSDDVPQGVHLGQQVQVLGKEEQAQPGTAVGHVHYSHGGNCTAKKGRPLIGRLNGAGDHARPDFLRNLGCGDDSHDRQLAS